MAVNRVAIIRELPVCSPYVYHMLNMIFKTHGNHMVIKPNICLTYVENFYMLNICLPYVKHMIFSPYVKHMFVVTIC
jgi:hypothetical protein